MDPKTLPPVDAILYVLDPADCSYYPLGRPTTTVHELNCMIRELVQNGKIDKGHSDQAVKEFSRALRRSVFNLEEILVPRAEEICRAKQHNEEMKKIIGSSLLKDASARDLTYLLPLDFMHVYRDMWREKNKDYSDSDIERLADREFVEVFVASLVKCLEWFKTILARMK